VEYSNGGVTTTELLVEGSGTTTVEEACWQPPMQLVIVAVLVVKVVMISVPTVAVTGQVVTVVYVVMVSVSMTGGPVVRGTEGLTLLEESNCSGLRHLLPIEINPEQQGRGTQGSPGGQVSAGAYSGWQELAAEEEETIEEVVDTTTVEEGILEDEWILEDERCFVEELMPVPQLLFPSPLPQLPLSEPPSDQGAAEATPRRATAR